MILKNININIRAIFITLLIVSMDLMNLVGNMTIKILFIVTFLFIINKLLVVKHNIYFNKYIIAIFVFFTLNSLYLSNDFFDTEQTVIYIFIISTTFYFLISKMNLYKFMKIFIYIVYILSIFALIQEILFQFNNNIVLFSNAFIKNPDIFFGILRVQSVFSEPNHFSMFLLPIIFIGIYSLFVKDVGLIKKKETIVILTAFFLTLSTGGFVSLMLVLILLLLLNIRLKSPKFIFMVLFSIIMIFMLFNTRFIRQKVESMLSLEQVEVNNKIPSGFGVFLGFKTSLYALEHHPLLGYGFKNYSKIENKVVNSLTSASIINQYSSKGLGYSNVIVEFGIVGVLISGWIVLSNIIYKRKNITYLVIINHASLIYLILMPIRFGQFTYTVFWFYFSLFLISKQLNKRLVSL